MTVWCRSSVRRRNFTRSGACYADYATKGGRLQQSGSIKISTISGRARRSTSPGCFSDVGILAVRPCRERHSEARQNRASLDGAEPVIGRVSERRVIEAVVLPERI